MPDVQTVDAVVIGSGHNGLVAANILADAGWSVLVLEAAREPGGAVRTGQITAPGFRNDLFSAFYPIGAASPVLGDLRLERHGLKWRHAPEVLAHVLPDDRAVLLSRELATTAKSLDAFAPGDGDVWRAEFAKWQGIRDDVLNAITRPFPPVRAAGGLLRTMGTPELLRFARMAALPVRRLGEEWFAGDGGRVLLAGNALHTDLGPEQSASGLFGWLLTVLGQDVGFPVPEGGASSLTEALVARLTALGGRVECDRRVTQVLLASGTAVGVRDEHGELVRATRAVLANVAAPSLFLDLVGEQHLPSRLVSDLTRFDWDDATVKVDWALSRPVPWIAQEAVTAGTVHLGGDLDGLAGFSNELACGRVPRNPFLLIGQMTTTDPTRSPAGTESMWAYTHVPRGQNWTTDRLRRRADRMEQLIEKHAPGFRELIMARAVTGPAEMARDNANLAGGAVNQGTSALHQQLVFRPVPGAGRADTPIDRLYLAGASAHPGGAVHGAAGANAARAALARAKWSGGAYVAMNRVVNRLVYG
ncbi:FAD-dependent oxidoreductase [Actinosynnema sp. ALI-1.44]|uniref:phytoene desaturase family protein n=1 Tax=Actinosynnema sp. ALI-1.44 TaxID=1933779 RepID=UPI00097CB640|nr:NAD(P)/FAD-dependent oxidoreductase [Actinosynnema sp. ALI-1.44]ONI76869.1 FAD-dependent oxidoreductase [Actinosynnema sp. ALI-1.44]